MFIGRDEELSELKRLYKSDKFEFVSQVRCRRNEKVDLQYRFDL